MSWSPQQQLAWNAQQEQINRLFAGKLGMDPSEIPYPITNPVPFTTTAAYPMTPTTTGANTNETLPGWSWPSWSDVAEAGAIAMCALNAPRMHWDSRKKACVFGAW